MFQKLIPTLLLSLALLVTVSSCKKDDDDKPATPATKVGINATVGGVAFSSTSTSFADSANTIEITGLSGPSTSLSLEFKKATGTYNIADFTSGATGYYTTDQGFWIASGLLAGTGTITVTSVSSTNAVGTFSFTAKPFLVGSGDKVVTNGTFNVTK